MNKVALIVVAIIFAGFGLFILRDSDSPHLTQPGPEQAEINSARAEPEVTNALSPQIDPDEYQIEVDRLYDPAYANDPDLLAYAQSVGMPPECIIAVQKLGLYGERVPDGMCPLPPAPDTSYRFEVPDDHPYNNYTNAQLEDLSTVEAEAAIILARRTENNAEAERLYEIAVALTGKPGPLEEWMTERQLGSLQWENDVIDAPKAEMMYEIYLTMNKFGAKQEAVKSVEETLTEAGIPLEPIQERADARYARITQQRQQLIGASWGDQL